MPVSELLADENWTASAVGIEVGFVGAAEKRRPTRSPDR
jgi:hypothetical protein